MLAAQAKADPAPATAPISAVGGGSYAVGAASVGASPASHPAAASGSVYGAGAPPGPPAAPTRSGSGGGGSRRIPMPILAAAAAIILVLVGGGVALALMQQQGNNPPITQPTDGPTDPGQPTATAPAVPADEQCTDAIMANTRWVCLTSASITGNELRIEYEFDNGGTPFDISGGFHLHIYGASADGSNPEDRIMGSHVPSSQRGNWYIEDKQPSVHRSGSSQFEAIGDSPKVCARMAQSAHRLVEDTSGNGTFVTGNCVPITRS
jgi:hypothetical protein